MIGAAALGYYPSISAAAEAMLTATARVDPDATQTAGYDAIYRHNYSPLYGRLKSLFMRQA
jgi:sugar (pentulose or hexulose) kinase